MDGKQHDNSIDRPFTIRIRMWSYLRRLGLFRFVIAATILGLLAVYGDRVAALFIIGSVVTVLTIGFFYLKLLRVEVTDKEIRRFGGFAKKRTVQIQDLAPVLGFSQYIEPGVGVFTRVILRDKKTGVNISLQTLYWELDDILRLATSLEQDGVKTQYYADAATSPMIAQQFPDYLSLSERRPYAVAFGVVGFVAIAVAVIVVALELFTSN